MALSIRTIRFRAGRTLATVAAALAFVLSGTPEGRAQELQTGRMPPARAPSAAAPGSVAPAPAATPDPERVRTLLRALHGFSRTALDTVSTDVPAILMGFIDDPAEAVLVKRQAIKALALYPTDPVLSFIEARTPGASNPYKTLFVGSLGAFAASQPARVTTALTPLLADADLGVRATAAHVAGTVAPSPALTAVLQARLATEPSGELRAKLQAVLARP
jgi:hypothetical protein